MSLFHRIKIRIPYKNNYNSEKSQMLPIYDADKMAGSKNSKKVHWNIWEITNFVFKRQCKNGKMTWWKLKKTQRKNLNG